MMRRLAILLLAAFISAMSTSGHQALSQPAKDDRVVGSYLAPEHPALEPLAKRLKDERTLERVRQLLLPVRWPRPLRLELRDCNGEANAGYENAVITVCYELLGSFWQAANASTRPAALTPEDAFLGQSLNVFLHEAAHALFDLLKIPVLGQEEDAADQLAGYYLLQLPDERKRNLILGSAYAFSSELKAVRPRDLSRLRLQIGRHIEFADEHGTPAQRLYNVLCLAYGSDKKLFGDLVEKGFLPKERAEICADEYKQVDLAYRMLIAPHTDAGE
jgi:hypothetical protein